MKQFFTSIETSNGRYIGVVYNPTNNEVVYRTESYHTQAQATLDVTEYLKTQIPTTKNNFPKVSVTARPGVPHPAPQRPHKCCGR